MLNEIGMPRCHRSKCFSTIVDASLHCFSDASFIGYGVAIHLRLVDTEGRVEVSLVMGKSRVSPLKQKNVPRLELTAGGVSVKIGALVIEELKIPDMQVYYWVDSKIVLGYIFNETRRFRVFVANRVQLIDPYTEKAQWRYIDTKDNPGDIASRGLSPRDTEKVDIWFNGPYILRKRDDSWKHDVPDIEIDENDEEVKKEAKVNAISTNDIWPSVLEILEEDVSSWHRMKRVIVWVLRCLLYTSPSPRDRTRTRMPSSA